MGRGRRGGDHLGDAGGPATWTADRRRSATPPDPDREGRGRRRRDNGDGLRAGQRSPVTPAPLWTSCRGTACRAPLDGPAPPGGRSAQPCPSPVRGDAGVQARSPASPRLRLAPPRWPHPTRIVGHQDEDPAAGRPQFRNSPGLHPQAGARSLKAVGRESAPHSTPAGGPGPAVPVTRTPRPATPDSPLSPPSIRHRQPQCKSREKKRLCGEGVSNPRRGGSRRAGSADEGAVEVEAGLQRCGGVRRPGFAASFFRPARSPLPLGVEG